MFWHPKGWTLFPGTDRLHARAAERSGLPGGKRTRAHDAALWAQSGHLEKFGENMYTTKTPDERLYAIKPMNCPGHVQIFKHGMRSYRDLPVRIAEFGKVHRYEPSGALHGLMRVRAFTQDDAHIFITEDQITSESVHAIGLLMTIYRDFGFDDVRVKFADRPPKRIGSDEVWDRSEQALQAAPGPQGWTTSSTRARARLWPEARVRAPRRDWPRLAVRDPAGRP